jgi:hypothetical protein
MYIKMITREEIAHLHILPTDVLTTQEEQKERNDKLMTAAALGNLEKGKCKITFHAEEGDNYIETTIWAVTDKYICLKGGITLLIASIIEVSYL